MIDMMNDLYNSLFVNVVVDTVILKLIESKKKKFVQIQLKLSHSVFLTIIILIYSHDSSSWYYFFTLSFLVYFYLHNKLFIHRGLKKLDFL